MRIGSYIVFSVRSCPIILTNWRISSGLQVTFVPEKPKRTKAKKRESRPTSEPLVVLAEVPPEDADAMHADRAEKVDQSQRVSVTSLHDLTAEKWEAMAMARESKNNNNNNAVYASTTKKDPARNGVRKEDAEAKRIKSTSSANACIVELDQVGINRIHFPLDHCLHNTRGKLYS
jgi:hypothetical protein